MSTADPATGKPSHPRGEQPAPGRAIVVCDQWLGSDGLGAFKALRRAEWNVLAAPEWEYVPVRWRSIVMRTIARALRAPATREYNGDLLRLAERFQPELLLVFKGRFVEPETLRELRHRGVRCYCFYTDVSFRAHGPLIPRALPEYDWVFTTKSFGLADMREQLGVTRASLINFAFDPDLHRPIELPPADRRRFDCDVSYIGTWSPKKEGLLGAVVAARPNVHLKIWGEQWGRARTPGLSRAIMGHEVIGEDFVRAICGSAINLSILSERRAGSSMGDQIANRTFTVPASGGFVLHERTPEVLRLFTEGVDIVCFDGVDELVARIDEYLGDAQRRREIAERGRALVWENHSWDQRVMTILAHHNETRARAEGAGPDGAGAAR